MENLTKWVTTDDGVWSEKRGLDALWKNDIKLGRKTPIDGLWREE